MSVSLSDCKIIKYADDTVILGLIHKNDESLYRKTIQYVTGWCEEHYLQLNVKKTKEVVFDFRISNSVITPVAIKNEDVDIVENYKYLGCIIDRNLNWKEHVLNQSKKANKRLYYLYYLRKLNIDKTIITMFYNSVISSVLTYSLECWFTNISDKLKKQLNNTRKRSSRITGTSLATHQEICETKTMAFISKVMNDKTHPLYSEFRFLPSGKRLDTIFCRTTRFKKSLVPHSIKLFNSQPS